MSTGIAEPAAMVAAAAVLIARGTSGRAAAVAGTTSGSAGTMFPALAGGLGMPFGIAVPALAAIIIFVEAATAARQVGE